MACSLGADAVTEQSLASRTGWFDIINRSWWSDSLDWSRIDERILPRLVRAGEPIGILSARDHPRLTGAVATIAGHDHQAAAVGLGATSAGDAVDSSGTAEALVRTIEPIGDPDRILALTRIGATVGWHSVPWAWCVLAATEGGLHLSRVLAHLGAADPLEIEASGDPGAREIWAKAAAAAADEVGALDEAVSDIMGARGPLIVTGGWTRSAEILAAKRRRFGPLVVPAVEQAGARGAAILAGKAAGLWETEKPWPPPGEK